MKTVPGKGSAAADGQIVVIGCGNLLRGDDAIGPIFIRELFEEGWDNYVTLVDGGTAGMDVAFKMCGARKVVLFDAFKASDTEPGTIYRVPGEEVENLPDLASFHSHSFRWDHSLAFARWLLKESEYPKSVVVILVSVDQVEFGAELSERARSVLPRLKVLLAEEIGIGNRKSLRISAHGHLVLPSEWIGNDMSSVGLRLINGLLEVYPLHNQASGRPLLTLDNSGSRGVQIADLIEVGTSEELVEGAYLPEREMIMVAIGRSGAQITGANS